MESKYNYHGVNKNTYNLLFNEKEEGKLECSKEIDTIELFTTYPTYFRQIPFYWLQKLVEMWHYRVNYFHIRKKYLVRVTSIKIKMNVLNFILYLNI